jgi:hypothetical protein
MDGQIRDRQIDINASKYNGEVLLKATVFGEFAHDGTACKFLQCIILIRIIYIQSVGPL